MAADALYLVAGCTPWSRRVFDDVIRRYPGRWDFVSTKQQLTAVFVQGLAPKFIFFLHWSWLVPAEIIRNFECVCFHMTDVPYGRGGSPLQNLIIRGHRSTKLTALRMTDELDAGPVYFKESLSLDGSAEEVYLRANLLAARMIGRLIHEEVTPVSQQGEPVFFKRRMPEESRIPQLESAEKLHDFIRMLDAEGYPHAFLEHAGFRFEFTKATVDGYSVGAQVTIRKIKGNSP